MRVCSLENLLTFPFLKFFALLNLPAVLHSRTRLVYQFTFIYRYTFSLISSNVNTTDLWGKFIKRLSTYTGNSTISFEKFVHDGTRLEIIVNYRSNTKQSFWLKDCICSSLNSDILAYHRVLHTLAIPLYSVKKNWIHLLTENKWMNQQLYIFSHYEPVIIKNNILYLPPIRIIHDL